jgi:hypothetical protein
MQSPQYHIENHHPRLRWNPAKQKDEEIQTGRQTSLLQGSDHCVARQKERLLDADVIHRCPQYLQILQRSSMRLGKESDLQTCIQAALAWQ